MLHIILAGRAEASSRHDSPTPTKVGVFIGARFGRISRRHCPRRNHLRAYFCRGALELTSPTESQHSNVAVRQ